MEAVCLAVAEAMEKRNVSVVAAIIDAINGVVPGVSHENAARQHRLLAAAERLPDVAAAHIRFAEMHEREATR